MTSAPPPFIETRCGRLTRQHCSICLFMWEWKPEEIAKNEHGPVLDAHQAEHAAAAAVVASGGRAKR